MKRGKYKEEVGIIIQVCYSFCVYLGMERENLAIDSHYGLIARSVFSY